MNPRPLHKSAKESKDLPDNGAPPCLPASVTETLQRRRYLAPRLSLVGSDEDLLDILGPAQAAYGGTGMY